MDEETYYISEVLSETEEKPVISKIDNKIISHEKKSTLNKDRVIQFQRLPPPKRRKVMKVSINDKKLLAKLVEKEPSLWDKNNELHFHTPALMAAWKRISKQMGGRDVTECRLMWKSLKDAVRYRKNKIARAADVEQYEYEMDSTNWEFGDCLSYLMDASSSSIARRPQRTFSIDFESSQASDTNRVSTDCPNTPTTANRKMPADVPDDSSVSESSFSYMASAPNKHQQPEDDPLFVESMVNMANSIKELAKGVTGGQNRCEKGSLKFDYIWQNLESYYQKLPEEDVDELNFKFIQMAYERVQKVRSLKSRSSASNL